MTLPWDCIVCGAGNRWPSLWNSPPPREGLCDYHRQQSDDAAQAMKEIVIPEKLSLPEQFFKKRRPGGRPSSRKIRT